MKIGNQAFENSLRCIQHPLSLLSIALLLLNDHVFKVISPSWLTGKLSDFAGLFFFPFIVAAGLSVLLSRFNFKPRVIGPFSFTFAVIWFFFLKTSPFVNSVTSRLASSIVGYPTEFILDWTDLVGLVALLPSWGLWNQNQRRKQNRLAAYATLSIAAFAAIATSPSEIFEAVTDVEFKDEIVYGIEVYTKGYDDYPAAWSKNGGLSWNNYGSVLDNIIANINEKTLPVQACSKLSHELCFKVTDEEILYESKDKGETWSIVTPSQYKFTHAYDVIVFTLDGHEYALVAIGESGVLRRELPDGKWKKISVLDANK